MGMEQPQEQHQEEDEAEAAAAAIELAGAAAADANHQDDGWGGWFEVQQQQRREQEQRQQDKPVASTETPPGGGAAAAAGTRKRSRRASSDRSGSRTEDSGSSDSDEEQQQQEEEEAAEAQPADDEEEELDEVELMLQLGVQLEQQLEEVDRQGLPPHILARWVAEEAARSASQWQPQRPDAQDSPQDGQPPDPARVAGLGSVEPPLCLLRSRAALRRLVLGCAELLGAPVAALGPWCSSNCPTPLQQLALSPPGRVWGDSWAAVSAGASSHAWTDAAAGDARPLAQQPQQQHHQQQQRQPAWFEASDERWQWLVNLLQRLAAGGPCSDWPELCTALILLHACKPSEGGVGGAAARQQAAGGGDVAAAADGSQNHVLQLTLDGGAVPAAAAAAGGGSDKGPPWPSKAQLATARAAARQLLSDERDNLLLFDAYGCLEAAAGQSKAARKVFENALSLASAAAAASSKHAPDAASAAASAAAAAPLLALHLAQLELSQGSRGGVAKAHCAVHALLAGVPLQAAAAADEASSASSMQAVAGQQQQQQEQQQQVGLLAPEALRKARLGFQQRIPQLLASAGGALTPAAAATIAAAALLELLVGMRTGRVAGGLDAAAAVHRQVAAAVPEAVRAASPQHEQLAAMLCHMLVAAAIGRDGSLVPGLGSSSSSNSRTTAAPAADAHMAAALTAAVPPSRARTALAAALQLYPHSAQLLEAQVALDRALSTLAGLRQQLAALVEASPSPGLWWVCVLAEAGRPGGGARLKGLFERSLAPPTPLQWQQQEQRRRQRVQQAWAAAAAGQGTSLAAAPKTAAEAAAQRERQAQLQLQPASAAAAAAGQLDVALADGYHGWAACSALWRQNMQHELATGRLDAARKLFLRAVHACPGAKAVWLCGFAGVCAGLQPRECSGMMTVLQERECLLRTDVYEVLLSELAAQQQQL